jgi:hypothetical protein
MRDEAETRGKMTYLDLSKKEHRVCRLSEVLGGQTTKSVRFSHLAVLGVCVTLVHLLSNQ